MGNFSSRQVWYSGSNTPTYDYTWISYNFYPRISGDIDGDSKTDIAAFGYGAVATFISRTNQFDNTVSQPNIFNRGGAFPTFDSNPRAMGDVDGDGKEDIVGFANNAVMVGISTGTSFVVTGGSWIEGDPNGNRFYTFNAGWTSFNSYPRMLADVDGDKRADIVGFGPNGVMVSSSTGSGFAVPKLWSRDFTVSSTPKFESFDAHPRAVADVDGDGKGDVIGFAADRVIVALSTGLIFGPAITWLPADVRFPWYTVKGTWSSFNSVPRVLVDVNGDGRADIVGFSCCDVSVALSTGTKFVVPDSSWTRDFGARGVTTEHPDQYSTFPLGTQDRNPRAVADVDGDCRADLTVFSDDNVYVALSQPGFTIDYSVESTAVTSSLTTRSDNRTVVVRCAINVAKHIIGSSFGDNLIGDNSPNTLEGGDGDDTIEGRGGADSLDGGSGVNTVSYANSPAAVTINLATGACSGGDATGDTIANFANLIGSRFDDAIVGNNSNNTLTNGGGNDQMTGNSGFDVFKITRANSAVTITDFECDKDKIDVTDFSGVTSISQMDPQNLRPTGTQFQLDDNNSVTIRANCPLTNSLFIFKPSSTSAPAPAYVPAISSSPRPAPATVMSPAPAPSPQPVTVPELQPAPYPQPVPVRAPAPQPMFVPVPAPTPAVIPSISRAPVLNPIIEPEFPPLFTQQPTSPAPAIKQSANADNNAGSSLSLGLGVGLGVGIPLLCCIAGTTLWFYMRNKRRTDQRMRVLGDSAAVAGEVTMHAVVPGDAGAPGNVVPAAPSSSVHTAQQLMPQAQSSTPGGAASHMHDDGLAAKHDALRAAEAPSLLYMRDPEPQLGHPVVNDGAGRAPPPPAPTGAGLAVDVPSAVPAGGSGTAQQLNELLAGVTPQ